MPFCLYHFVHTILYNNILSVYHFVHTILSVPVCPRTVICCRRWYNIDKEEATTEDLLERYGRNKFIAEGSKKGFGRVP